MKLLPYTRYSGEEIGQKAIEERWTGQGTPENPYIIESTHSFSQQSVIRDTSLHILVRNCTFKYLTLNRCKNFKFERCNLEVMQLLKCSDTTIEDCSFKLRLDLINSNNLQIQGSTIPLLKISQCYENHFKSCEITQIYNHFSRANTFEQIQTSIQDFDTILGLKPKNYFARYLGFALVGIISLISAIVLFLNSYGDLIMWSLVGGLMFLSFITIVSAIVVFLDFKKMKRYPPNKILA